MDKNEKSRREIEKSIPQFKYCALRQLPYSINFKYENDDFLLSLSFSQNHNYNYSYNVVSLIKISSTLSVFDGKAITRKIKLESLTSSHVFEILDNHFTSELIKS
jgi:hypothetical protein